MLHHTFDHDPENPLIFVWSEAYKNDEAFIAHLANPAVGEYLKEHPKLADKTDKAVEAVEPGMLHHTFDQDPENPLIFVWSEAYKNDEAFIAHLANPAIGEYLKEHPILADDFTVEVYGTVGDKCLEVMKGTGVPFKVFQSKLGYIRL